ncbi:unnamed protein product [Heterobilharzia americana]|nr:unnamed protein product [Heterobilharzia americana]
MNYQVSLSKLSDNIQRGSLPKNDSIIIFALEQASFPVEQAFCNLTCLTNIKEDFVWTLVVSRLYQKLKTARREYFCRDSSIYDALLTLKRTNSNLDEFEKGLLDAWIYDCWIMGTDLLLPNNKCGEVTSLSESKNDAHGVSTTTVSSSTIPRHSSKSLEAIHDAYTDIEKEEMQFQVMVGTTAVVSSPHVSRSERTGRIETPSHSDLLTGRLDIKVAESDLAPSAPYWLPAVLVAQKMVDT